MVKVNALRSWPSTAPTAFITCEGWNSFQVVDAGPASKTNKMTHVAELCHLGRQ
jgi:hypothetical protein